MSTSQPSSTPPKKSQSAYFYLLLAGGFMVIGISVLIIIGRQETRLRGQTIAELDIKPLLYTSQPINEEDRKGKVVVFFFWGFWDQKCIDSYKVIAALQKDYKESADVMIVSVSCEQRDDDSEETLAFYTKKTLDKLPFEDMPVYCDPAQFSRAQISRLFTSGGFSYPTTLVIDRDGKIESTWRGEIQLDKVKRAIESAKQRPASP